MQNLTSAQDRAPPRLPRKLGLRLQEREGHGRLGMRGQTWWPGVPPSKAWKGPGRAGPPPLGHGGRTFGGCFRHTAGAAGPAFRPWASHLHSLATVAELWGTRFLPAVDGKEVVGRRVQTSGGVGRRAWGEPVVSGWSVAGGLTKPQLCFFSSLPRVYMTAITPGKE